MSDDGACPMSEKPLRAALLGCGTVGSEVVRLLNRDADDLASRIGRRLEIAGIAVRRPQRPRDLAIDPSLLTADADALVARDDVDVVVEVVGGIEPARSWVLAALRNGKSVVTANKALLPSDGPLLHEAASAGGADLYYESSPSGPLRSLRLLPES